MDLKMGVGERLGESYSLVTGGSLAARGVVNGARDLG